MIGPEEAFRVEVRSDYLGEASLLTKQILILALLAILVFIRALFV